MKYEAIFIDWDGTLSNSKFWERWNDDPDRRADYAKIQKALFESAEGRALTGSWMRGFATSETVLERMEIATGISYVKLEHELSHSAKNMRYMDMSVLDSVQQLRNIGKQVVIATDNMDTFDKWTVPALGLNELFDDILNSSRLRKLKSEIHPLYGRSEFFHRYLNDMGINPQGAVLIDNNSDARVLESTGMDFMHVTNERPLAYHLNTLLNR